MTTAADGKRRRVGDLKLAAIVAAGYCVRSTCDRHKNRKGQHVGWPFW
nr:K756 [uncultured bacterium]